jgi:hypothetical protein
MQIRRAVVRRRGYTFDPMAGPSAVRDGAAMLLIHLPRSSRERARA